MIEKRNSIKKKNINRGFDLGSYWRKGRDYLRLAIRSKDLRSARLDGVGLRPVVVTRQILQRAFLVKSPFL